MDKPFELIVVGGCAAALAYKVESYTLDIDTIGEVSAIEDAAKAARVQTGLDIPLEPARVHDTPYNYEDRLQELRLSGLCQLKIVVPEKHDLVLMKVVRGYENDLETIEEIAQKDGLDFETLLSRFTSEMSQTIGDPAKLRLNFLAAIERVFGEEQTKIAKRAL